MEEVKCFECEKLFDKSGSRLGDSYPICPECDDKNQEMMDKAMNDYFEYEDQLIKKDQRLLNAVKSIKGDSFYNALKDLCTDAECTTGISLVDKPKGDYQKEFWHRQIQGIWVDQWCNGGYVGDDFQGDIYVKIKRNNKKDKYLKIPYSM